MTKLEKINNPTEPLRRWINALRSGEYKQCKNKLRSCNQYGKTYCAAGVLCDLYYKEFHIDGSFKGHYPNSEILEWVGLNDGDFIYSIARLNDWKGYSFELIASEIEENII